MTFGGGYLCSLHMAFAVNLTSLTPPTHQKKNKHTKKYTSLVRVEDVSTDSWLTNALIGGRKISYVFVCSNKRFVGRVEPLVGNLLI